ncbi:lipopolysaccharide assembly protein LapA domain-containing protein [Leptolyngbya sp. FACHB-261]|uniref:lipopolysaccharide assembly protein LapA domain-containing protein n=1 Tax=Leptolyngbya sp. FACHB-261 TaxID=2692806 RepID=UPI001689E94F|nr:LapA family protein [Leptolyngbya sp. FACHB-261]MBD2104905.1 LapA family protein [Leptolyngbya sp. FACHB-261]
MRQINFVLIFVIALALVLFSLENTELASIQLTDRLQLQAPIAVELILAMGLGAVLAWLFSVWGRLQRLMALREKNNQIQQLQQQVQQLEVAVQEQRQLPPAPSSEAIDAETVESSSGKPAYS